MNCRMGDLRNKEVINVRNGVRIGFISDIEMDTNSARLTAVVIYGRNRGFGLLSREDDIVIPWQDITLIGDDTVLVKYESFAKDKKKGAIGSFLDKICF